MRYDDDEYAVAARLLDLDADGVVALAPRSTPIVGDGAVRHWMTMRTAAVTRSPREQIIDAALALVADGGLDALTIGALITASGVSNGSIYHHFGSRDGVIAAVFLDSFERCVGHLTAALDDRGSETVVRDLVARYVDWIAANPARARFLYAAPASGGMQASDADAVTGRKHAIFAPVAAWFARRAAEGEIRQLPVWSLDPIVMGPAHECARRHLDAPGHLDLAAARDLASSAAWAIVRPVDPAGR